MKVEEHERARLKLEEGVRLALESRRRTEEENLQLKLLDRVNHIQSHPVLDRESG